MKRYCTAVLLCIITSLGMNCASTAPHKAAKEPEIKSLFYLPAEVVTVDGQQVTIRVEKPALFEGEVKLALQLAQGIIENSYVLEGKETRLNQARVQVVRVIGNDILLEVIDKTHSFKPGDKARIALEKKIVAIQDFEVIMGRNTEVAKYVQEDLTTALVNSGQFHVVERLKLQSVINELKLSQLGMIDSETAKQAGKLLGADVILTGTLAATGEEWNVNLRIINTETGLIAAAINKRAPLHELKAETIRDIGNIDGAFEDTQSDQAGWIIRTIQGSETGKGGYQKIYFDDTQGANGTNRCIAMDFKLGSEKIIKGMRIHAKISNQLKRDLSGYTGIQFYIKADRDFNIVFFISDSDEKGAGRWENWFSTVSVKPDWQAVKIPFDALSIAKSRAEKLGTNEKLELKYVEMVAWGVNDWIAELGTKGTIWLDEVSFY